MKFDTPAGANPIDRMKVVGKPHDRIDGPLKTSGTAPYAYERHDAVKDPLYAVVLGTTVAKGRITRIDLTAAEGAPGVRAIVTHENAGKLTKGDFNTANLLAGPQVQHYDQAVAIVVADSFEQARAASRLIRVDYARAAGAYDLAKAKGDAKPVGAAEDNAHGDFAAAFSKAPVTVDQSYSTPDQAHAMMEPHATTARWDGDALTLWTANQMIDWGRGDVAKTLGIAKDKVRLVSPYIGGGFGGKLFVRAEAIGAALGSRAVGGRAVKAALSRPQIFNNTTHRPATIQRVRLGADRQGKLLAVSHESWSGDLPGGGPEVAADQTKLIYASPAIRTRHYLATLDLPEGNAMRAPGEAVGLMALEVAMDELAEKCGLDPVDLRILNDTQVDPMQPDRPFSTRDMAGCFRQGAGRFGWSRRNATPGQERDGRWLVGMGTAAAFRNNITQKSAARVGLDKRGVVTVATDMTDIGTGTYTIVAQTAAEMLGVDIDKVVVLLGDSSFPVSAGSGGQWGANSATAGVYAACVKLREAIAAKLRLDPASAVFDDGKVRVGNKSVDLADAGPLSAEDAIEFGDLGKRFAQSTFGAHFVEVGVDVATAEVRVRRMLAVCSAGRILNPKSARSQVIGAMTMGVGSALMEHLVIDKRFGLFINHDLAGYEVPVHADIPHQDVIFLDEVDDKSSPMKAKGVGELGICGVGAAVANAIYNACGVRVRDFPITLDKLLPKMPAVA